MKYHAPLLMVFCSVFTAHGFAAAMDQSGQSILPFLENGHYFEASISAADPEVSGRTLETRPDYVIPGVTDYSTDDIAQSFQYYSAALKLQLTPLLSFGILYDQPFGADIRYKVKENGSFSDPVISSEGTIANVDTENLAMLFGIQPTRNLSLFAGPVYETVKGEVSLRGLVYQDFNGYDAQFSKDSSPGWLAGFAWQIPDIALKAAVTYRSEIKHKLEATESIFGTPLLFTDESKTKITTPQSVNIDFQSGVAADTLLYSNIRWVNWKDFSIRPVQFGALSEMATTLISGGLYTGGFNLDDYNKDQWSATLGLARQWNRQWATAIDAGWDSGTGEPASILNPTKGYWSAGLSFQFNPEPSYFIAAGVKYYWLGDTESQDGTYYLPLPGAAEAARVGDFENNNAIGYGLKIGYHF